MLALSAASNVPGTETIRFESNQIQSCFPMANTVASEGPVGQLFKNDEFELLAQYSGREIYEVRLASKKSKGTLVFLGVSHVTSANPELFQYLENTFEQAAPSESYVEVSDVSYLSKLPEDRETVINTRGEPSYLGFIARKLHVPVFPLEPDSAALYASLRPTYSADQILLSFVLREAQLERDRWHLSGERLEYSIYEKIKNWNQVINNAGDQSAIVNILELTKAVAVIWPGLDWRQIPAQWFNPLLTSKQTGGSFTNEVIRTEKSIRDQHYAELLFSRLAAGKSVIAMAGRNHVYSLGIGFKCLLETRK